MRRTLVTAMVTVVAVAACGSPGSSAGDKPSTTSSSTTTAMPVARGPAQWRDVTAEWKQRAPDPFSEGPDAVAEDLAAAWRGGDTSEVGLIEVIAVRHGEPLVVVLRESGGGDQNLVRTDVEITLEGGDEGWAISTARAQDLCRYEVAESEPTRCV